MSTSAVLGRGKRGPLTSLFLRSSLLVFGMSQLFVAHASAQKVDYESIFPSYKMNTELHISSEERDALNDDELHIYFKGEKFKVTEGPPRIVRASSTLPAPVILRDLSFVGGKNPVIGVGNGTTPERGIYEVLPGGSLKSMASIPLPEKKAGRTINVETFYQDVRRGKLLYYSGCVARNHDGDLLLTLGNCSPNALIKYDTSANTFQPLARIGSNRDIDVYQFDPDGIYVTFAYELVRFGFTSDEKVSVKSHLGVCSSTSRNESLIDCEAVSETEWIIHMCSNGKVYRTLLVDLEERKYSLLRDRALRRYCRMAVRDDGKLAVNQVTEHLVFEIPK